MKKSAAKFFCLAMLSSCSINNSVNTNIAREEIIKTEHAFEASVKTLGLAGAFAFYADENAVIRRQNDTLIKGRENIRLFYENPKYNGTEVSWSPDFAEVSDDGTLGYTFGKYVWKMKDTSGSLTEYKGVFHTVWKKQKDGTWRYVWD